MQTVYLLILILYLIAAIICLFVFPFCYVLYTGKFQRGVLLTWGVWFLFLLIHDIFLPGYARLIYAVYNSHPDLDAGLSCVMLLVGWIPGLIISYFALMVKHGVLWLRCKKARRSSNAEEELHK